MSVVTKSPLRGDLARWRTAYDAAYDFDPDWPENGLTLDLVQHVRRAVGASKTTSVWRWLRDPAKYSPYLDEIALERAMHWDWGAIDNLSYAERREFVERMARHSDPFGVKEMQSSLVGQMADGAFWSEHLGNSKQYAAFTSQSLEEREIWRDAVASARREMKLNAR